MDSPSAQADPAPRRVRIPFDFPLGDLVVLGGVLRELHRSHPGAFDLTVESSLREYWNHCPHARVVPPGTPLDPDAPPLVISDLYGRALHEANRRPRHLLEAIAQELNAQLDTRISLSEFRGEAVLHPQDLAAPGPVERILGRPVPYWVLCNGGKFDRTVKWWPDSHYQRIVSAFRGRILFVQVGRACDYHPRLTGTLDLRGSTDLPTLLRLIHRAEGVLCPITSLMHLAAAVPRPPARRALRPCVVIAGAIEPAHLTAYPGHRFLSTVGTLPCTADGCWRSRTVPLGDGSPSDAPDQRCLAPERLHPQCMRLVEPQDVIRAIEPFLLGEMSHVLSAADHECAEAALPLLRGTALDDSQFTRPTARLAIERQVTRLRRSRLSGVGRGIVTLASGLDYVASAWVMAGLQRALGCRLPIEVWLMGNYEWLEPLRHAFARWRARVRFHTPPVDPRYPRSSRFAAKPELIIASDFREVLWLDADSFPARDPADLFEIPEYKKSGAVFWPDIAGLRSTSPDAWTLFGLEPDLDSPEVQGGELLLDKSRVAAPLLLARWCNRHFPVLYRVMLGGDKDVYRLAFRKLGTPFAMPSRPPELIDGCLFPTDFHHQPLFQHRVASKLRVGHPVPHVSGFLHHATCQELLDQFTTAIVPHLPAPPNPATEANQTTPVALQTV